MNTPMILLSTATAGSMIRSILPIALICVVSIYFMQRNFRFINQLNKSVPVLYENPRQFIKDVEEMLKGKVPKSFQPMLILNIAVGYEELGDYPSALKTLDRVKDLKLGKQNAYEYHMNLAHIYVQLGEKQKALDLIHGELQSLKRNPGGGNLPRLKSFLETFSAMEENDWVHAQKTLDYVKKTFPTRMAGVDFNILYKRMNDCLKQVSKMSKTKA